MKPIVAKIFIFGLLLTINCQAAKVGGITLPKKRGELSLQGAGLLRKGVIFKIYVGALYLQRPEHAERILSDVPKQIDIHYFHRTPKKHMINVANETLKKNLSQAEYRALRPMIQKLHAAYLDGKKNHVASLIFSPGKGLTYRFDNKTILSINDDHFANAYLSIWLGENPSSKTIKEALLNTKGKP